MTDHRTPLLFWDVDTQIDFMLPEGKLHVEGAEALRPNLERLHQAARRLDLPLLASADDHEPGDAEISDDPDFETTYPPHCLRGTEGAERIEETRLDDPTVIGHEPLGSDAIEALVAGDDPVRLLVLKKQFDVFTNPNTEPLVRALDPARIILYGVALDVCNRHAVEGLLSRGWTHIAVVTDAVEAIDKSRKDALLADWGRRGVERMTTTEAIEYAERLASQAA